MEQIRFFFNNTRSFRIREGEGERREREEMERRLRKKRKEFSRITFHLISFPPSFPLA